ncbi:MAG: large conductance mechanosensitive channel protein MscL [Actinomycetota bacterium]
MLKEFKAFALRGNVLDLAVAVILGIAFGAVVASLVDDVLMNLIAAIFGQPDFSELTFTVNDSVIRYGSFINALVNFLLISLALFLVVRVVNRAMGVRKDEPPAMRECPFCRTSIPVAASRCSACTSQVEPQPA